MTLVLRLLRDYSSYLCKSRVPCLAPPLRHFYSTSTVDKPLINPTVLYFLSNKHHFSPAEAASVLSRLKNPEKSDALLSFLKQNGFSDIHLEKILKYNPSFISADLDKSVKPKIRVFQELGFSDNDIANLFAKNASIVYRSMNNHLIPTLRVLRSVVGSDANVVKVLMKSGWFLVKDLEKSVVPNIEFLKSHGVDMEQIISFMHYYSRLFLLKPENLRKHADKAVEMGAEPGTRMYIHGVRVIASHGEESWELKLQAFRNLGFSEDDIVKAFKSCSPVFAISVKKMVEVKEILVSTGKYDEASIISCPMVFGISIEKRLKPRVRVLAALECKNFISKWPRISVLCKVTDEEFFRKFVGPYMDEVGHLFAAKAGASFAKTKQQPRLGTKTS